MITLILAWVCYRRVTAPGARPIPTALIADLPDEETLDRHGAILEAVSFIATKFLSTLTWEESIHEALKRVGESAAASRVYIFENERGEDGSLLVSQRYEWVAAGITPQIDNPELQDFDVREGGFTRWEETLSQGQPVYGIVDEFPASER
ncbi:MAG TPA: hypothetical protein VJL34_07040, partial [Anaerolineales bacterium]|nr:hypothetical protein [Anaerolineales bacterium]